MADWGARTFEDVLYWKRHSGVHHAIDKTVLDHWKKYDLKLVLEANWKEIGPNLAGGKINVWVGDSDDYYLNAAVHRLKAATAKLANPRFDGTILIEMRQTHCSGGWNRKEVFDAMAARAGLKLPWVVVESLREASNGL